LDHGEPPWQTRLLRRPRQPAYMADLQGGSLAQTLQQSPGMKALLFIIFLLFDCRAYAQKAPGLVVSWRVRTGLDRPENVHFSKSTGNFYVTNVAGPYGAKDGSGWVTQILPGGTVISEKWVSGLNAPKG